MREKLGTYLIQLGCRIAGRAYMSDKRGGFVPPREVYKITVGDPPRIEFDGSPTRVLVTCHAGGGGGGTHSLNHTRGNGGGGGSYPIDGSSKA